MEIYGNKSMPKNAVKYVCNKCNFSCSKESNWNNHNSTQKHKRKCMEIKNMPKNAVLCHDHICSYCNKKYKTVSGLWKHKKKCSIVQGKHIEPIMVTNPTENNKAGEFEIDKEMLIKMLLKNQDVMENVILKNQEVMEKMMEAMPNIGNVTNTNSHNTTNNQFNIQMFLNNHCKNAMNLTDFIDSLPITAETYDSNIDNGLTKTIANMFTTGLNQLDILERPIHCTDASRKTLYVKEGDVWEKDNELLKMIQGIRQMAAKQRILINTWRNAHDDWNVNDRMQDRFTTLVCNMVEDIENQEKETNKIIRSISKEVYLNSDTKSKYLE
jgi:hypothetical protein